MRTRTKNLLAMGAGVFAVVAASVDVAIAEASAVVTASVLR